MKTFIVCGYGMPDVLKEDQNYLTYLHVAFNTMFSMAKGEGATIIPCGGPTRCEAPFEGTEAEMISEYLQELMSRNELKEQTSDWQIIPEKRSLSTLENQVFAKEMLDEHGVEGSLIIFCEKTREERLRAFAEKIFVDREWKVMSIDFDISMNRYIETEVLQKKEAMAIKDGLWALEDSDHLSRHHEFFEKKLKFLREQQEAGLSHVEAVNKWTKNVGEIMHELMPDHPLLSK